MKVLYISHSSIVELYRQKFDALVKHKDIELTVLVPKSWPEGCKRVFYEEKENIKRNYKIISSPVIFEGSISRYLPLRIKKVMEETKPDILHIDEEPWSFCSFIATFLAKKKKSKILFFTWENIKRKYKYPLPIFEKYVLRNADYALTASKEAKEILIWKGFKKPIEILPTFGIDPDIFKKYEKPKKNCFTIGFIGRIVEEKGIQLLIEAINYLNSEELRLLIIGEGPFKTKIEEKLKLSKLDRKTTILSAVAHDRIPYYLNTMDLLVLPSMTTPQWKEQFGRILIEAMACKVPVIGSSSGAIPEVIGDSGLIFKENDINDLKEKIEILLKNKDYREMLGKKGRERVLKNYTNEVIAKKIFEIYKKLSP